MAILKKKIATLAPVHTVYGIVPATNVVSCAFYLPTVKLSLIVSNKKIISNAKYFRVTKSLS